MKLIALALLAAGAANAGVVGVVDLRSGASLRLYDDPGVCVGKALRVEYVEPGQPVISGCWVLRPNGVVTVVFLDGDRGDVPAAAVRKPESL